MTNQHKPYGVYEKNIKRIIDVMCSIFYSATLLVDLYYSCDFSKNKIRLSSYI